MVFNVILMITVLFFFLLLIKGIFKKTFKKEFCVICVAVSLTWITLLILSWLEIFNDKTIIALLMGMSILGIFYLVENKVKEGFKLFRLSFLLSLILIGYLFLGYSIVKGFVFVLIIWILFLFIYVYRNNKNVNRFFNKLLECCKRW